MAMTNFIWDELSDNVLIDADGDNATEATYANIPSQFGEVVSQKRDAVQYYNFDGQGSTRALTTDTESVSDTFVYTAFGESVARTGNSAAPFEYQGAYGYYTDAITRDIYVRRRTYSPKNARWLSADPLWLPNGVNGYITYGVPNSADPSGTTCIRLTDEDSLEECLIGIECTAAAGSQPHFGRHCGIVRLRFPFENGEFADVTHYHAFGIFAPRGTHRCDILKERAGGDVKYTTYILGKYPNETCNCLDKQVENINRWFDVVDVDYALTPFNPSNNRANRKCNSNYVAKCLLKGCGIDIDHPGKEGTYINKTRPDENPAPGWGHRIKTCVKWETRLLGEELYEDKYCVEWRVIDERICTEEHRRF